MGTVHPPSHPSFHSKEESFVLSAFKILIPGFGFPCNWVRGGVLAVTSGMSPCWDSAFLWGIFFCHLAWVRVEKPLSFTWGAFVPASQPRLWWWNNKGWGCVSWKVFLKTLTFWLKANTSIIQAKRAFQLYREWFVLCKHASLCSIGINKTVQRHFSTS